MEITNERGGAGRMGEEEGGGGEQGREGVDSLNCYYLPWIAGARGRNRGEQTVRKKQASGNQPLTSRLLEQRRGSREDRGEG